MKLKHKIMKNLFKSLFGMLRSEKSSGFGIAKGKAGSLLGLGLSQPNDKYKSYAYACINARAENVSKAKIILFEHTKDNYEKIELKNHKFLDLIQKPNKRNQSFKELLHKVSSSLDLYGNSYIYVHRNTFGEPIGLYHLPSKSVKVLLNSEKSEVDMYLYFNGKSEVKFSKRDIIHFLIPDPDNSFTGKSIISGFNYSLDIDFMQNLYQKNFYLNNASLGVILESENPLTDEQYYKLKDMFEEDYSGAHNAGKALILEGGVTAKPYQANPRDVEILPSRKMIRDEILAIFRVPKIILGITEEVNRANSRESMKIFNDYVIKPFTKICIESKLNIFLRENYSEENLELAMEYEFEIDRELQLKTIEIYSKYGLATNDELRELEGFGKNTDDGKKM